MTTASRSIARALLAASVVLKVVAVALVAVTPASQRAPDGFGFLVWTPGVLAFAVVGTLIAARHPQNAVGWIFLGVGLVEPIYMVAEQYARLGTIVAPGSLPGAALAGTVGAMLSGTLLVAILLIALLFPTGHLPSPAWRPMLAVVLAWLLTLVLSTLFAAGPISDMLAVPNPLAAPGDLGRVAADVRALLDAIGGLLVLVTAPALIVRWRRSESLLRAQLTWLVYAIGVLVVAVLVIIPIWEIGVLGPITPAVDALFTALLVSAVAGIPVAAGIAILRYRLYDIDVVIRRTLVYGAVVGILGVAYVAIVLGTQSLLAGVTRNQTLPVAVSTLAIAALFGPVRGRVRELVDRRFYRSRYDAQRTLEAFAARLRDEVELDAVGGTLVDVAGRAVRPAHAAVWVRERPA